MMQAFLQRKATATRVANEEGSTRVVDAGGAAACFSNCRDCNFTVTGRAIKLIVEGCRDCSITMDSPITTGTAEVINSHSVRVYINHRVPTIQIDGCSGCQLLIRDRRSIQSLYTAKTSQMSIVLVVESEGETNYVPYELDYSDGEWELDQFITRFVNDDGPPLTEKVIREGAGYPTTVREKEINDAREKQLEDALANLLASRLFRDSPPNERSATNTTSTGDDHVQEKGPDA